MTLINRSPLSGDEPDDKLNRLYPLSQMTNALAELEAMAWLHDNQMAAQLIGAARLALRST